MASQQGRRGFSKAKNTDRSSTDKEVTTNQLKKKLRKTERGQTKKQMREEKNQKKQSSKHENRSGEKTIKEEDIKVPISKRAAKVPSTRKDKKPIQSKLSGKRTGKILYTEDNINSFLLEAKEDKSKTKATGMLLFIFKHFKSNPAEILSKLKILTSNKKIESESDKIHERILQHLAIFFESKETPIDTLFAMLSLDTMLAKYVSSFLFSIPFESSDYQQYFDILCEKLCSIVEKVASMSMSQYMECISEMDTFSDLCDYKVDSYQEDVQSPSDIQRLTTVEQQPSNVENAPEIKEEADVEELDMSEPSSFSLVSLDDAAEIERLDTQLGSLFRKGMLSNEEEKFAINLIQCLEILIKSNYAVKTEDLIKILYFHQFACISKPTKFVVKDYLQKIREPKRIFKIFTMCSILTPNVYQFYNLFSEYCAEEFDLVKFLICVFNFEQEDILVNRIDKDRFYSIYDSNLGDAFDNFLVSLISTETRLERLQELNSQYFKPEIKSEIEKMIEVLENKKKVKHRKGKKRVSK